VGQRYLVRWDRAFNTRALQALIRRMNANNDQLSPGNTVEVSVEDMAALDSVLPGSFEIIRRIKNSC
jgi:hypothetical protein